MFGHQARNKYWDFDPQNTPLNHGSYGATPIVVHDSRMKLLKQVEKNTDRFMRVDLYKLEDEARQVVANWIDSDPLNTAFVPNASMGFNAVIRSLPLKADDVVVYCNTIYGACAKTLAFMENRYGVKSVGVELTYPEDSDEDVVRKFKEAIEANPKTKLVIFDTVSSQPGCLLPYNEITALCREKGVLSFIDGAHGLGLIPISLRKTQPDFFVSNLHKWGYTPRGSAVLYVDKKHHRTVHTLPVSHTYLDDKAELDPKLEERRLIDRFTFVGTLDFTTHLSVAEAWKFRQEIGGEEKIREYCFNLAKQVGELAAKEWGTEVLENKAGTLSTAMVNVRLPISEKFLSSASEEKKLELFRLINDHPMKFDTFVPPSYHNGKMYVRFSCQVYNELSDYMVGIKAIDDALKTFPEATDN